MVRVDVYKERRERAIKWLGASYLLFAPINRRYPGTLKTAAQKGEKK